MYAFGCHPGEKFQLGVQVEEFVGDYFTALFDADGSHYGADVRKEGRDDQAKWASEPCFHVLWFWCT